MRKIELIGEIGTNHNGSLKTAFDIMDMGKRAGLDCVKIQLYDSKDIVTPKVKTSFYGFDETKYTYWYQYINDVLITPKEWLPEIVSYANQIDIDLLVTAHSIKGAEYSVKNGVNRLKIASMDCNHFRFLEQLTTLGVPLMISTGMANKDEIANAMSILKKGVAPVTLFHCIATYPANYEEGNISFFNYLTSLEPDVLGLSDHSMNNDLIALSIPFGISVIEKHITLDNKQDGPDHGFALDEEGCIQWRTGTDNLLKAMGNGEKQLSTRELENRKKYRRKIIANNTLNAGELLSFDDVYFARPEGLYEDIIQMDELDNFLGKEITDTIEADTALRLKHFKK